MPPTGTNLTVFFNNQMNLTGFWNVLFLREGVLERLSQVQVGPQGANFDAAAMPPCYSFFPREKDSTCRKIQKNLLWF
jgi:hypothetical protein